MSAQLLAVDRIAVPGRLQKVTASFARGRVSAICGPNGAGKSTLLQVLAGLLDPSDGQVALGNARLPRGRERACRIGYLPQGAEVAWDLSVSGLVELGRLPYRDRAPAAVAAALAATGLAPLASRPISTLSGGERARALLARVLAGQPEWILADEPLAALDLAHQLVLLGHLRTAAAAGAGIVLVVHDLAVAMNHADHVLVLDNGRVAGAGRPHEALSASVIRRVWGVDAKWLGGEGGRALCARPAPRRLA